MKKQKLLAIGAAVCIGAMSLPLAACSDNAPDDASAPAAFVSLNVNPSIQFTLDGNNKVLSVYGANEDGQVLLYGENGIIGEDIDAAVAKVTELAVELGYIDADNKVIQTDVTAITAKDELLQKVNASISAKAGDLNIDISTTGDQAYSLLRKLDSLKAEYPNSAAIKALTPEKLKLVLTASENGNISIEAAAELDEGELIKLVSDVQTKAKEYASLAYDKARSAAYAVYDKAVDAAVDAVYTKYHLTNHPRTAYYAYAYCGYKSSATAMRALSDTLYYAEQIRVQPLDETQIDAAAKALGLSDNVDALKNSDGEITVESIEAYADKKFKNSDAAQDLQAVKTELTAALESAETAVRAQIEKASVEFKPELDAISGALSSVATTVKGMELFIPAAVKEQFDAIITDVEDVVKDVGALLSDGELTSAEVKAFAVKLDEKSKAMMAKADEALTADEKQELLAQQKQAVDSISSAADKLDKAIADAETQARQRLADLKAARKNK